MEPDCGIDSAEHAFENQFLRIDWTVSLDSYRVFTCAVVKYTAVVQCTILYSPYFGAGARQDMPARAPSKNLPPREHCFPPVGFVRSSIICNGSFTTFAKLEERQDKEGLELCRLLSFNIP